MATRNDVAKLANVSPSVVSYVINNSNYVSAEKRKAVLEAIEELDYHSSYAAKSLKKNRTYQLLVLVDDVRTELFSEIVYYVEQYAFERGYFVSVASCTVEKALNFMDVCFSKRYDGVFLLSNVYSSKHLNSIAEKGIPVVIFLTRIYEGKKSLHPDICQIDCNYLGGVGRAIDYLIDEKGHRNIGYVISPGIGSTDDESKPYGDGMRIHGYIKALERHGIPVRHDFLYTLMKNWSATNAITTYVTEDAIREMMERPPEDRVTALLVSADRSAAQICRMLAEAGYRVPGDVDVISIGDTYSSRISRPSISTLSVPKIDVARYAVDALITHVETGQRKENAHFEMKLIQRESS